METSNTTLLEQPAKSIIDSLNENGHESDSGETEQFFSSTGKMKRIMVECKGITPLLMASMDEETIVNVLILGHRPMKDTETSMRKRAAKSLYLDPKDNWPGIPAQNLFACLREAGRHVIFIGRTKISTAESTLLPSFLSLEEDFLRLTGLTAPRPDDRWGRKQDPCEDWVYDVRRGQMDNGTTVGIVRPKFDNWGFKTTITVDLKEIDENKVKELFRMAGRRVGLCSFRPEKNGMFGQFQVTSWTEMEDLL